MRPKSIVIADDLTGAAEIGGVAVRFGLSAEILIDELDSIRDNVTVIDTNTRSRSEAEAAEKIVALSEQIGKLHLSLLFKKVDSVLRGPVLAEIRALLQGLGMSRALLIPGNPELGRIVAGGRFFISGLPIDQTEFGKDPQHPILSSDVLDMLSAGKPGQPPAVLTLKDRLPLSGIIVGEAAGQEEIALWAERLDYQTLAVGAAPFFSALLRSRGLVDGCQPGESASAEPGSKRLLVSGTASKASRSWLARLHADGIPVLSMPEVLYRGEESSANILRKWSETALKTFETSDFVVLNVGHSLLTSRVPSKSLTGFLTKAAARVLRQNLCQSLWIEGGETASSLIREMGETRFKVLFEIAPGVVCLRPAGKLIPQIILKPGSYPWTSLPA